jgi:hypothetical protein
MRFEQKTGQFQRRRGLFLWLALLLIVLGIVRSAIATRLDSLTLDEPYHIAAGVSYVKYRDFRVNPEQPPLVKLWVGAVIAEMGYGGLQGEHMVVVENSTKVHNLVVCTLCSCYPWPVLGLPPVWYKSAPYRSRAVIDPRGVQLEFGLELPKDVEVLVWDSTAELRYLVLPEKPAGTEGMSEEALAALVTRDSMVGVAKITLQKAGAAA